MNATIRSSHPIDESVRETVLRVLRDIEQRHDVTVLYACESGSRAWGFASPDSDYDVRFIYVHRLPWYLTVEPGRDVIELPIHDTLDVGGWELRKSLQLLLRSNPVLLEWLDSPVVYCEQAQTMQRLRELTAAYFSPVKGYHHYFSMAKKNYHDYLQEEEVRLKKYLYALRPLLGARWIETRLDAPPMRFADLVEDTLTDTALIGEIDQLLETKMRVGEAKTGPRRPLIHAFIENELERLAQTEPPNTAKQPTGELDQFFMETVQAFSECRV